MGSIHCCKDCADRVVGCHATCEKYIEEKAENERLRHEIEVGKAADRHIRDARFDKRNRLLKKYGKSVL